MQAELRRADCVDAGCSGKVREEMINPRLTSAEVNHLRRLIAWVRCEYFLTPEEVVQVVRDNMAILGEPSKKAKARLVEWHKEKSRIPKYVHAAVKALSKTLAEQDGDTIDAEMSKLKLNRPSPPKLRDK